MINHYTNHYTKHYTNHYTNHYTTHYTNHYTNHYTTHYTTHYTNHYTTHYTNHYTSLYITILIAIRGCSFTSFYSNLSWARRTAHAAHAAHASPIPRSSHSVLSSMTVSRSQAKISTDGTDGVNSWHLLNGWNFWVFIHPTNIYIYTDIIDLFFIYIQLFINISI